MVKKIFRLVLITIYIFSLACASKRVVSDDDFGVDSTADSEELSLDDATTGNAATSTGETDEFAEFENENPAEATPAEPAPVVAAAPVETTPPPEVAAAPEVTPPPEVQPELSSPVVNNSAPSKIKDVRFLGNDNGGTLVISADQPLNYKTRMNNDTNQMVVEVQNVILPEKFKRPLNTKDMTSVIGSVDAYQNRNSNVARFVVQLKSNVGEPLVQPEGNSLLIVASPTASMVAAVQSNSSPGSYSGSNNVSKMSNGSNLEDFMANNVQFYGRPISIETTNMNIIDILKFISEEGGINMIFDDGISGSMSLKLRKVPWDQALTTVLKAKKLGYRRQGEVFRIATLETLTKEEDDAIKLRESRMKVEPLIVRNFQINYANITELEAKIKEFISDSGTSTSSAPGTPPSTTGRGRVTSDARTNTMIVTDTAARLAQVEKLLDVLDTQPQQVLIEGRVVEASESYGRTINMGLQVNSDTSGITGSSRIITRYNQGSSNPLLISPSLNSIPSVGAGGALNGSLWLGKFGPFGDLAARLSLDENETKIKILSAPRVTVLHGQTATINQGSIIRVPNGGTVSPDGSQSLTFTNVPVGVSLKVKPLISNVGTVNLDLTISRSAADGNSGATTNRDVTTNIIVRSGDTAVIGGVFQSDVTASTNGVPGLKDIPILGTLFKGQLNQKGKNELMFFISPQILKPVNDGFMKANAPSGQSNQ